MKLTLLGWLVTGSLILGACATGIDAGDVKRFVQRRDHCEHFRGEFPDPPDPERSAEVEAGVDKYCTGTDAQLARLKVKYAKDAAVMKILDAYVPGIEATVAP